MPRYMIQTSANSGWTDTEVVSARHAGEALRKHRVASFVRGQKRAIPLPMVSDYKPNEGLTSLMSIDPSFESRSYRAKLANPLHVFPIDNRVDKTPAQAHAEWANHVAKQDQYPD